MSSLSVFLLALLAVEASLGLCPSSASKKATDAHLVASMYRNATGHWLVTLDLEQNVPASRKANDTPPLQIDARPSVTRHGDTVTHALYITLTGSPLEVNSDYEYLSGLGYYRYHENITTWMKAKDVCNQEGAHLLIINSVKEAEAIKDLIRKRSSPLARWIYVGFYRNVRDEWVTLTDQPLKSSGYDNWRHGESHSTHENVGCVSSDLELGSCISDGAPFICELIS